MSRCFPFPPPGYEKKARANDADILTKEKQKEKKQKKDKRDKEKSEGKEKDKERSKEKHREKKDRKGKHKDKKEKGRDKDKKRTSDEKRIEGQPQGYHGQKLSQNSQEAEAAKDSKFVQELDRRIRDERGTGNQMVKKFTGTDQRRAHEMERVVEKDIGTQAKGKEKNKDTRGEDRMADGQRNRDEERGMGNAMVQSFTGMDQRRVEGMVGSMEKDAEKRVEGKDKNKDKESEDKRGNKHKGRDREKKSKGMVKDKDKQKEKEEKREHKNKEHDKLSEGSKDPVDTLNIKLSHLPEGSNKSAAIKGNLGKRKGFKMNGFFHGESFSSTVRQSYCGTSIADKWLEHDLSCVFSAKDDNDVRPNKLTRPASSSHPFIENGRKLESCQTAIRFTENGRKLEPFTENGRKLEPCQAAIQFTSEKQGTANYGKVDSTEHKINGIVEAEPSSISSTKLSFVTAQANENGEASTKSLHPDSKFLSQILLVPKVKEWSDFDDQEWLFSSDHIQSKEPRVGSSGVTETPQVWAEALQIESADVCALPYVIPY
ncbi:hypothetical protein HHK36_020223 [Tetracentron sinense]|uniref:Uncharacterized protein n=1 Tax=Tetracentron sinense TaxID=13715 RepID=A0A835D8M5_TETSI|nr:hypothetical protein HHK36_020223 [Tetracentron sinense]